MTSARGLPEGCPPEGHVAPDGTFYRLTRGNLLVGEAPSDDEWRLPVDKPGPAYRQYDECDAYAHSVFGDVDVLLDGFGVPIRHCVLQVAHYPAPTPARTTLDQLAVTPTLR